MTDDAAKVVDIDGRVRSIELAFGSTSYDARKMVEKVSLLAPKLTFNHTSSIDIYLNSKPSMKRKA